jgi:hypothetical protein
MPHLNFALSPDGMVLQAMIGLNGPDSAALIHAGQPIPSPIHVRALVDPGSDRTGVAPHVFQLLRLGPVGYGTSQTAGGSFQVSLYRVSLSVSDPRGRANAMMTMPNLLVSELPVPLPFDALIGLDVLRECLFVLDGPGQQFILGF